MGMKKIKGIYKITSPSGRVYIGLSSDINKRMRYYRNSLCKGQVKLYASIKKYGFENHKFEIAHELPYDTMREVLETYERLYIELYKNCGVEMLNLTYGGEGNSFVSESTREKLRIASKGKTFSKEARDKSIAVRLANGVSKETRQKRSQSLKGRPSPMKGRKHKPESCEKIGKIWRGKKQSEAHIQKRAKVWVGRKHTEESKKKMSDSLKGRSISPDSRTKISISMKGKKFSRESIKKRIASRRMNKLKKMGNLQLF